MQLAGHWISLLLDLLAPPACAACDAACTSSQPFCPACAGGAEPSRPSEVDGLKVVVAGPYRPPLSTAIVRFKYANRPELGRPLARLLLPALRGCALPAGTALVPVPLHPRRLVTRGYNQAALLAAELGRSAGLSTLPRLLRRTRETERQVGKSREERLQNSQGAFTLRQAGPRSVVLVDDVITTGSTVRACAQALAAGGVPLAAVVALARAEQSGGAEAPQRNGDWQGTLISL
jgi:ComF family protein